MGSSCGFGSSSPSAEFELFEARGSVDVLSGCFFADGFGVKRGECVMGEARRREKRNVNEEEEKR